jgi:hypothetical protein
MRSRFATAVQVFGGVLILGGAAAWAWEAAAVAAGLMLVALGWALED